MEYLKTNKLGQWELIKSERPRFDPRSEWSSPSGEDRSTWLSDTSSPHEAEQAKQRIPRMEGEARNRALSKLTGSTEHRRNPASGKVEFLLHRGMSTGEAEKTTKDGNSLYSHGSRTSWTPNLDVAHRQAFYEEPRGKVVSAWVPEEALHTSMRQFSGPTSEIKALTRKEDEWIVSHGHSPHEVHQVSDAINPRKLPKSSK